MEVDDHTIPPWRLPRDEEHLRQGGKKITIYMHRVIMDAPSGMEIDHKNLNGLDNQKHNLRVATRAQNSRNAAKIRGRKCTSQFKGVSWKKRDSKWRASITVGGKARHLGTFDSEEQAAIAYNLAALTITVLR